MTSHDETELPGWAADLAGLDEADFLTAWGRIVGEPPAAILPRGEMVAILAETIDPPPVE